MASTIAFSSLSVTNLAGATAAPADTPSAFTGDASDNLILGDSQGNVLDGGLGMDCMVGGAGDDTYIVDDEGDVVVEKANGGIDTIRSSVSFDMMFSRQVEHLVLTGSADLDVAGNTRDNHLTGNSGNNRLNGGPGGNDTLEGGNGSDTYVFKGRIGADVVRDHHTPPPAAPLQPVQTLPGGTLNFSDLGGSLSFSPDVWSLVTVGGAPYNPAFVNLNDSLHFTDISIVDLGGTLTLSPVDNSLFGNGLTTTTFDPAYLGLTLGSISGNTFDFGGLTGATNPFTFSSAISVNPLDLHSPDQWDEQPNTDSMRFEDVSYDKLWFRQIGQDLEVSVVGTTDKVTVRDWYTSPNDQIELTYDAGNAHVLRHDKVQSLVSAMAGFAPQALSGNTTLMAARDAAWTTL